MRQRTPVMEEKGVNCHLEEGVESDEEGEEGGRY